MATMTEPLTFEQIYRNLSSLTALAVATIEPLRKQKDERDTAFVKRIVARFMSLESERLASRPHPPNEELLA